MASSLKYLAPRRVIAEDHLRWGADFLLLMACFFAVGFFQPQYGVDPGHLGDLDLNLFVAERAESSIFNQIKWLALAGTGSALVLLRTDRFLKMAALTWPIILLMGLALVSAAWSVDPGVTLRRGVRAVIFVFVVMVALTYVRDWKRALLVVYFGYWAIFIQNIIGFAIPGTFDIFGNFTGATSQKNQLGIVATVGILTGVWARTVLEGTNYRRINLAYLAGWWLLLVLSFSKTAIALLLVTPLLSGMLVVMARSMRLSIGATFLMVLLLIGTGLAGIFAVLGMAPMDVVHAFKKDVTFTGRTEIWAFLFGKIEERMFDGFGFGAFWGLGTSSPNLTAPYPYMWYLDSAHNGYLDVIASVGFIGMAALALVLVHLSVALDQIVKVDRTLAHYLWWIVLFILSHNMMESSLLRAKETAIWFLFLFVYFVALRHVFDMRRADDVAATAGTQQVEAAT